MTETTTIALSVVGTGIGIVGVMGLMLRILTTNITKQFELQAERMSELKADLNARIDEMNRRIDETNRRIDERIGETNARIDDRIGEISRRLDALTSEMHQRFDRVHEDVAELRERMAKLEGSLDGFLAGRRDRDAA